MKLLKSQINPAQLIMVEEPYLILNDLFFHDDEKGISASVKNQYKSELEAGPMCVGEFGRHGAILGSLALALHYDFQERYFFLATEAKIKRRSRKIDYLNSFCLQANVISAEKRTGHIYCELTDINKKLLFTAEISYQVLSKSVFSKLFSNYYHHHSVISNLNPYIVRKKLSSINIGGTRASAIYGEVQASECEGHFTNYPALPVAILGNLFSDLGITLFNHFTSYRYDTVMINVASLRAYRLVFAGEYLNYNAEITGVISDESLVIECFASVKGEVVSKSKIEFVGVIAGKEKPLLKKKDNQPELK